MLVAFPTGTRFSGFCSQRAFARFPARRDFSFWLAAFHLRGHFEYAEGGAGARLRPRLGMTGPINV